MAVVSAFDFRFSDDAREEGVSLCRQIGADMVSLQGYMDHQVVQDVGDAGHLTVTTRWRSEEEAQATLSVYRHDPKIQRTRELMGRESSGFVGRILKD